jgi:hypothetical protein
MPNDLLFPEFELRGVVIERRQDEVFQPDLGKSTMRPRICRGAPNI